MINPQSKIMPPKNLKYGEEIEILAGPHIGKNAWLNALGKHPPKSYHVIVQEEDEDGVPVPIPATVRRSSVCLLSKKKPAAKMNTFEVLLEPHSNVKSSLRTAALQAAKLGVRTPDEATAYFNNLLSGFIKELAAMGPRAHYYPILIEPGMWRSAGSNPPKTKGKRDFHDENEMEP